MLELLDILKTVNDDVIVLGGDFNAGPATYDPSTLGISLYHNIDY